MGACPDRARRYLNARDGRKTGRWILSEALIYSWPDCRRPQSPGPVLRPLSTVTTVTKGRPLTGPIAPRHPLDQNGTELPETQTVSIVFECAPWHAGAS